MSAGKRNTTTTQKQGRSAFQKRAIQFALRNGRSSIGGVSAQAIGEELQRISEETGSLTASRVVDEARPSEATLHPCFEWNDRKAGELYRHHQSRELIKSVVIKSNEKATDQVPVYVHISSQVQGQREGTYEPLRAVVQHPDKFILALADLQSRVDSARKALENVKSAAEGNDPTGDRLSKIALAVIALQTANDVVHRLH